MSVRPPRRGQELDLTAGPWDAEGNARCEGPDGWEVRVAGAIPGEALRVEVEHVSRGARVSWAGIRKLVPASEHRRKPPCAHYKPCGGCPVQQAVDGVQFALKVDSQTRAFPDTLTQALAPPQEWILSPQPLSYRHKAVWRPEVRGGQLLLGGRARRSADVVDLPECEVLTPALRSLHGPLVSTLQRPVIEGGLPLRSVVARSNRRGQALVTWVLQEPVEPARLRPLARELAKRSKAVCGVHLQVHQAEGNTVSGREPLQRLLGKDHLDERIGPVRLQLAPLDFFQVQPVVLETLGETALQLLGQHPRWAAEEPFSLLELYCGGGVLGLLAAKARPGLELVGIDAFEPSIATAGRNAERNGIATAGFLAGDAAELLENWDRGRVDAAIVDPPRAGMKKRALELLAGLAPERIVYLSCSGPSLARDAQALGALGYALEVLVPADMMPQTPHVEWLALFRNQAD